MKAWEKGCLQEKWVKGSAPRLFNTSRFISHIDWLYMSRPKSSPRDEVLATALHGIHPIKIDTQHYANLHNEAVDAKIGIKRITLI